MHVSRLKHCVTRHQEVGYKFSFWELMRRIDKPQPWTDADQTAQALEGRPNPKALHPLSARSGRERET